MNCRKVTILVKMLLAEKTRVKYPFIFYKWKRPAYQQAVFSYP